MGLFLIIVVLSVFLSAQPTGGQYYCNGRSAITQQWGGCNGSEAVCSSLMQAVTQTWNWFATVNNTAGNSIGLAAHNFFTTDAYTEMLSFTNNNTAYPSVCTKIAKIVAQLLIWNATKSANVLLGNTCVTTARIWMFCTVIPGWGYTIGDYVTCGSSCTNYSINATKTPNDTGCPICSTSTTSPTHSGSTNSAISTTTTSVTPAQAPAPPNTSTLIFGDGYYLYFGYHYSFADYPSGGAACSSPYAEIQYIPGLNTPQSSKYPISSPFVPAQQANSTYSAYFLCYYGEEDGSIVSPTMCLCSTNGSCYYMNQTSNVTQLNFYAWCDGASNECVTYLGLCAPASGSVLPGTPTTGVFYDVATGQMVTNCTAINAGGPLQDCYPGSTNCSYLQVEYINCGPCPTPTMEYTCSSTIDEVCEGAPSVLEALPLILPAAAPGGNFPIFAGNLPLIGTCNNCTSPNTTQYFYANNSTGVLTCMNGSNRTQVDWSGFCACEQGGACYSFAALGNATAASINSAVNVTFGIETTFAHDNFQLVITCTMANPDVAVVNDQGGVFIKCSGIGVSGKLGITYSLTCSGGCPANGPLELYCPGPYVPA